MNRVLDGRYELLDRIGDGGMAVTYRAHDHRLGRMVAVKVMREHLCSDPQFQERFRREAQAAASLSHENIANVHDSGEDGDSHFIVMELVEGEDLKRRLRRTGRLPVPQAVDIALQVARALEAAHARGVVHRDVKPHNILITSESRVKVTDFGIAKAAATPSQTETGTIMGSVHYFSPEQARGEVAGPQADLYSLGVVLFEMLTGQLPFEGDNPVAVAHKQIYDPPPLPSHFNPEVPADLDALVLRCLAKDLSRRYASVTELLTYLTALQQRLESQPTAVRPPAPAALPAVEHTVVAPPPAPRPAPPPPPAPRPQAGSRMLFALVLLVLVLVGALVGGTVWMLQQRNGAGTVPTPDLYQSDVDSAKAVLRNVGLKYRHAGKEYSDYVAKGLVLRQEPKPDTSLRPGSTVDVWLSMGSRFVLVPDITRMSSRQAAAQLEAGGLQTGDTAEQYDPAVPAGFVISTDPPIGARAERLTKVKLVVSKGPEPAAPPAGASQEPTGEEPAATSTAIFKYTVPGTGTKQVQVRIEVEGDSGRSVLFDQLQTPGTALPPQTIEYHGKATVKVFVDDQPVESRVYGQ